MPALIPMISAGVGAAGSIYASSQANKVNKRQLEAQTTANNQQLQLQRDTLNQQQQNLAPYLQAGYGALTALQQRAGITPTTPGGTLASQYDIPAYMQQNPDVAARAQELQASGAIGANGQWKTAEEWVAQVQLPNAQAAGEQRVYPTAQAAPGAPQVTAGPPVAARPGFVRPDVGSAPAPPDLSGAAYQRSPGYEAGMLEGQRNLNANFGARGLLQSGAGAQAAIKFGSDYQDKDYDAWRNNQMQQYQIALQQYNQDRARTDNVFGADRQFGTGAFEADRGYDTNRYDTQTNLLQNIAQAGNPSQANQLLQNNANATGGLLQQGANNLSGYYGQQAQNAGGLAGNLVGIGQGLLGNLGGMGGLFGSTTPTPDWRSYNLGWGS